MDAAYNFLKKSALLFATALLVAAPSAMFGAVTLTASPTSVVLSSGNATVPVTVTVTASAAVTSFTVTPSSTNSYYFAVDNQSSTSTSVSFAVRLTYNSCGSLQACTGGTITVSEPGGASVVIHVDYNANGGGGTTSGTLSAIPTSLTFNTAAGAATYLNVQIKNSIGADVTYTITQPSQGWATVNSLGGSLVNGSSVFLQVNVNSGSPWNLAAGTYPTSFMVVPSSGPTLTVPISYVVGSGGGTGTSGSLSIGQTSVTLTDSNSMTFTVSSNAASAYTATTTTSWLLLNGGNNTLGYVNGALTVKANTGSLATGTYYGSFTLTNYNNSSDSTVIPVTLVVNGGGGTSSGVFSPSSTLTYNASLGSSPQDKTLTVTGTSVVVQDYSCNWVGTFPTGSNTFTIRVYPGNFSQASTYTCTIPFTVDGATQNLTVVLNLGTSGGGGGGGTTTSAAAPSTLNFAYHTGDSAPTQYVTVAGSGTYTISTGYPSGGTQFISASGGGSLPSQVTVNVIGGLSAGSYSGTISIVTPSGTQNVTVNLVVSGGMVLYANPGTLNVSWQPGQANPSASVIMTASNGSAVPLTVTPSAAWITVANSTNISTPASLQVSINPTGLANGLNTGSISISGTGAANTPVVIPVVVLVSNSSSSGGPLTLDHTSLTFSGLTGGSPPSSQSLSVTTTQQGTAFTASIPSSGCGWLTVTPTGSLTTNKVLTVSVNQAGLSANTYNCNITLASGSATQTVPVTFTVSASSPSGGSGTLAANPTSLSFTYKQGDPEPDPKSVSITSASGSANVGFSATITSGSQWLSVSVPQAAATPYTFLVYVNPAGVAAGVNNGNIQLTANGGSVLNVPVTLTVTSLTVAATPTTLTFNYRIGDQAPTAQTIAVSGGTGLTFSATAASTGSWLNVTPTTGTTPANLNVNIDPTKLTSTGQQTGTITVAGTGTATGSTTVNVTVNVTAPLPTITGVTNGASFAPATTISAGEVITIFGTFIGPSTPAGLTLDSNGNVSTTIGGVQVLVGGYPAPMIYASDKQVSAVVPYEIATPVFRVNPNVQVKYLNQTSNGIPVTQVASVPGIFTANSSGSGPGAILNSDNTLNSPVTSSNPPSHPANKGDIVVLYTTGEGQTNPAGVTGKVTTVNQSGTPLTPQPLLPIAVTIDGQPAKVTFWGEAPGIVSGVMQVNVQIPSNARSGDLPVSLQVGTNISQTGVTVSVK